VLALAEAGRVQEAVALGRETARREAGEAQAHYALGHALRVAGIRDEAMAAYAEAIKLQPDHAGARAALAALRP
jgi:Flp pilus assembly protein TadD